MRALIVPVAGVCLVFGLQASEWTSRQDEARAAMSQHDYNGAARFYEESIPLSTTPFERITATASYGIALNRIGRNVEARSALEQALASCAESKDEMGTDDGVVISGVLASVERSLGDYQSAERVLRTAIQGASGTPGRRAMLMVNLADLLREESRETEADTILEEASRLPDLPRTQRISVLVGKAELARDMHRWEISITDWNELAEVAATDHSVRLEEVYTGGLGETWIAAGNLARAEPLLRRSLQLLRDDPEASGVQVAVALALVARLEVAQNKLALAGEALDEAVTKEEKSLGPDHPQIAMMLELRASILSRRGEMQPARDDLERARAIMTSHFGSESMAVAGVAVALGDVEQQANQPAVAVADYGIAMKLLRAAGNDSVRLASGFMSRYAAALKAAHRPDEAKALLATPFMRSATAP